ncbi:MAG: DUF6794 domain-containing protein [Saprospiraceae bacterium]
MKAILLLIGLCAGVATAVAQQTPPETQEEYEKAYAWRVRQETLYGVYIPMDLAQVFSQLNQLSEAQDRTKFARLPEAKCTTVPFFGLGRWMSVNWGFYGGSRLTVYLNSMGLTHPDDMTRFLLLMYHRHLNKKPLDPKHFIDELIAARKASHTARLLQGEVVDETTRKVPTNGGEVVWGECVR